MFCCSKIAEAEAGVSVNEKKWLVMHMHVQLQLDNNTLPAKAQGTYLQNSAATRCQHGKGEGGRPLPPWVSMFAIQLSRDLGRTGA